MNEETMALETQAKVAPEPVRSLSRVLVIEDDVCLEPVWRHILWKVNPEMEMIWAKDSAEAKTLIEREQKLGSNFALVIADVYLEEKAMTGVDLWKEYGQGKNASPFVIVSSMPMSHYFKIMGSDPVHPTFLQKPLDFTECVPMIEGMLRYSPENSNRLSTH